MRAGCGLNWWGPARARYQIPISIIHISLSPFPAPRRHDVLLEPRSEPDFRFQMDGASSFSRVWCGCWRGEAGSGSEQRRRAPQHLCSKNKGALRDLSDHIAVRVVVSECRESHHAEVPGRWERRLFQAPLGPYRSRESVRQRGAQRKPAPVIGWRAVTVVFSQ